MILSESLVALYVEINIALVIAWILFWVIQKIPHYWKSISQKNQLVIARATIAFAFLLPIIINILSLSFNAIKSIFSNNVHSLVHQRYIASQGVIDKAHETAVTIITPQYFEPLLFELNGVHWFWWFLALGCIIQIIRFVYKLYRLNTLIQKSYFWKSNNKIQILFSKDIAIPFATIVFFTRHIVLPYWMLTNFSNLRVAVAHEGQHHRNQDTMWIIIMEVTKIFFFCNPVLYLWLRKINALQEYACDENLIGKGKFSPYIYGNSMWKVARQSAYQKVTYDTGLMGANFFFKRNHSQLKNRILMLNDYKNIKVSALSSKIIGILLLSLLILLSSATHLANASSILYKDFKAIRLLQKQVDEYFKQRDAAKIAGLYLTNGKFIVDSETAYGQHNIEKAYKDIMSAYYTNESGEVLHHNAQLQFFKNDKVYFSSEIKIQADYGLYKAFYTASYVKEKNRWWLKNDTVQTRQIKRK